MRGTAVMLLTFLVLGRSDAFSWDFPGPSTVKVCVFKPVIFPWGFTLGPEETVNRILIAKMPTDIYGNDLPYKATFGETENGITTMNGTYTIKDAKVYDTGEFNFTVTVKRNGKTKEYTKTTSLRVYAEPPIDGNKLKLSVRPNVEIYHGKQVLVLDCGSLRPSIYTTKGYFITPSNARINMTFERGGWAKLILDKSGVEGRYVCGVDPDALAMKCMRPRIKSTATFELTTFQIDTIRFVDGLRQTTEKQMKKMRHEHLKFAVDTTQWRRRLDKELESLERKVGVLEDYIGDLVKKQASLTNTMPKSGRDVFFRATVYFQYTGFGGESYVNGFKVIEGHGLDADTGVFVAPVRGIYLFIVSLQNFPPKRQVRTRGSGPSPITLGGESPVCNVKQDTTLIFTCVKLLVAEKGREVRMAVTKGDAKSLYIQYSGTLIREL